MAEVFSTVPRQHICKVTNQSRAAILEVRRLMLANDVASKKFSDAY